MENPLDVKEKETCASSKGLETSSTVNLLFRKLFLHVGRHSITWGTVEGLVEIENKNHKNNLETHDRNRGIGGLLNKIGLERYKSKMELSKDGKDNIPAHRRSGKKFWK